jgi:hypothetical protein
MTGEALIEAAIKAGSENRYYFFEKLLFFKTIFEN